MIALIPFEHRIRRTLVARARQGSPDEAAAACLTYEALCNDVDPEHAQYYPMTEGPFRGLPQALFHVSSYEWEHGRPLLSALVVQKATGKPGPGFAKMGRQLKLLVKEEEDFWRNQIEAVIDLWTDPDPTRILDAALGRIMIELAMIKQLVRQLRVQRS